MGGRCFGERRHARLEQSGDLLEGPSFGFVVREEHLHEGRDTEDAEDEVRLPLDVPKRHRHELGIAKSMTGATMKASVRETHEGKSKVHDPVGRSRETSSLGTNGQGEDLGDVDPADGALQK